MTLKISRSQVSPNQKVETIAGMPQGSRLGPLTFLLLIDNLATQCLTHKHVHDTTLSELLTRGSVVSTMQTSF